MHKMQAIFKYWLLVFLSFFTLQAFARLFFAIYLNRTHALPINSEMFLALSLGLRFDLRAACLLSLPLLALLLLNKALPNFKKLFSYAIYTWTTATLFICTAIYIFDCRGW